MTGSSREFSDKVVVITGAASGLGRECVRLFGSSGAHLVIVDWNRDGVAIELAWCEKADVQAVGIVGDVSQASTADEVAALARERFGGVDVLINNAAIDPLDAGALIDTSEETWDRVLDVNLKAAYLFIRRFVRLMPARGSIVNVASTAGLLASPNEAVYGISKAALIALTRSVARDLAGVGIRANCVCPGFLESAPSDRAMAMTSSDLVQEAQEFAEVVPLKRLGSYSEIARAIAFLASEDASYMTGASLVVDGGMTVARSGPAPKTPPRADLYPSSRESS